MAPQETVVEETSKEFFSDEHRKSYVAGLVREKEGYEARAAAHQSKGEAELAKHIAARAEQVQEQLDRIAGEAKTSSARAQRRAKTGE